MYKGKIHLRSGEPQFSVVTAIVSGVVTWFVDIAWLRVSIECLYETLEKNCYKKILPLTC